MNARKKRDFQYGRGLILLVCTALFLSSAGAPSAYGEEKINMYGIGSISKVITAAAVMKLAEDGLVDLDRPLVEYIPEFQMADVRYRSITPRMLLDHTSGLPGGTLTNAMLLGDADTYNHDTMISSLRPKRLKADPGSFGAYCNDGFTLAEILVERVTGLSFTDYVEREFTAPLGLAQIKTPQSLSGGGEIAGIFDPVSGRELPYETANVIGSGGIFATADDLVRLSEIFMADPGEAEGILSHNSAKAMEQSDFASDWNPDGRDTNLSYGLGWDCVEAYPFSRYGVKALVKGGDTSFFSGSLTVLPEENISCAVLTSGGSSTLAQLAAQEILMTYLDEIGRIEREEESEKEPAFASNLGGQDGVRTAPPPGWYIGTDLYTVSESSAGGLILTEREDGRDKTQSYEEIGDGRFVSTDGDYISGSGEFVRGSNGKVGKTMIEWRDDYLMASIYETYPGLGTLASYLPVGRRIRDTAPVPDSWQRQSGTKFWLVSEKYSSTAYFTRFQISPLVNEGVEGYLTFEKQMLRPAKIVSGTKAEFFQKIPGQAGRDLSDYEIVEGNGKTYFVTGDFRYVSEKDAAALEDGMEIVIGEDQEAALVSLDHDAKGRPVMIETPENGAWYVYDETGRAAKYRASSWTIGKNEQFLLPEKGKLLFSGEPGARFCVRFAEGTRS